ncbi:hypothetical protein HNQ07_003048 [Deinococcus metalli]|uniref:Uncharacterized protein n=1 Tax=Deinococcus metalli TaxID=1141878 RepID=A0A7W8NQ63_9DEIO|nr:hypothetical protein [Deinococcus metalli]MBB5377556.1 hypothetical protein [Deinococcus metalli]GHF51345.1 hypothetical protein GCM10017781_29850 [Deinococcus metalli]
MPDLTAAMTDLKRALGAFLERGRVDGVFHVQPGGPGSVPALADLDVPELHLDVLPESPTDVQRAALAGLGYVPETAHAWRHPAGWRVVLGDHDSGWRATQGLLRALLLGDSRAAQEYRQVYTWDGRAAADHALAGAALDRHARVVAWQPLHFAARAFAALDAPWQVAGGWALDLHAGRPLRAHDDVDIEIPRSAQAQLPDVLRGWRLDAAVDGAYHAFQPPLAPSSHQVHARHPELPDVLMVDVMLTDISGGMWHYRRDPVITRPLAEARRVGQGGLPYLVPEIVLLFKAGSVGREPRGKDRADFERARPTLDAPARAWLRAALERTRPGHPWVAQLA